MDRASRSTLAVLGTATFAGGALALVLLALPGDVRTSGTRSQVGPAHGPLAPTLQAVSPRSETRRLAALPAPAERKASPLEEPARAPVRSAASAHRSVAPDVASNAAGPDAAALPATSSLTPEQKEKLAAALGRVDWSQALKDMVAAMKAARANGRKIDMDACVEFAQVNLALTEAAKVLGLGYPQAALGDPTVRATIVPSWLGALGVPLDEGQSAAISARCLALPPANAAGTFLDTKQAAIQSRIALEQSLASVLTPQQMETYATNVADDPLMRGSAAQLAVSARSPKGLTQLVASYWSDTFQLDPSSRKAAQAAASQYVTATMAVPPIPPGLDPEATRLANLNRTSQLVQIQSQAEQALAASVTLSSAERSRATAGSSRLLLLGISR